MGPSQNSVQFNGYAAVKNVGPFISDCVVFLLPFFIKNNHTHDPSDNVLGSVCLICLFFLFFLLIAGYTSIHSASLCAAATLPPFCPNMRGQ